MSDRPFLLSRHLYEAAWRRWLNVEVEWDSLEMVKRKVLIYDMVIEGLIPLLNEYGYTIGCSSNEVVRSVSKVLYHSCSYHRNINDNYRQEDLDHYYYVLDDESWERFWSTWGRWCDVDNEKVKHRELIRICMWSLLDLEKSAQTRTVDEELGLYDENEDETAVAKVKKVVSDPYLQDLANGYFNPV